jgi:hypothetical protein
MPNLCHITGQMYPALATRGFNLPVATGVIGSLAVPRSGLARASLSRLVSWIELWVCPSACKIPLLARLRRNAARSRFHRAWLARRKNAYELCPLVSRRAAIRWTKHHTLPRLAERRAKPNTRMCMQWTWLWPTRLCARYSQVRRVRGTNHALHGSPRFLWGYSYYMAALVLAW